MFVFHCLVTLVLLTSLGTYGQYLAGSDKFNLVRLVETEILEGELSRLPSVFDTFHPDAAEAKKDIYRFDFPFEADYKIGLIVDPCRNLSYDCCMNYFGTPYYQALISKNGVQLEEAERVVKTLVLASEEVAMNYRLVYEDGSSVPESLRRTADDYQYIDPSCTGDGVPRSSCQAANSAYRPSPLTPPCTDNNFSLNVLEGCFFPNGTASQLCMQIGFSQNAMIAQCKGDPSHCGTFIEVHQSSGSPYSNELDKLSEVHLDVGSVSGYSTTVIPLTWKGNASRVLCSYSESLIRVGSMVYVNPSAPVCCCPPTYSSQTRLGSYFCPIGASGRGAYAANLRNVAERLIVDNGLSKYPYCHSGLDEEDRVMCSDYDYNNNWPFSRNCTTAALTASVYSSKDLTGTYPAVCPYFDSCGLRANGSSTRCSGSDSEFSFVGRVGKVVAYDSTVPARVSITFNDGRTAYSFLASDVKLELRRSMYELWWVQRTNSEFIVQKRKGFNVTNPPCTFDSLYQRYFPYAELNQQGVPIP